MKKTSHSKRGRNPKAGKSLGPVDDPEQHLHPEWWKRIFNSTYLKTDADVVGDDKLTEGEVTLFKKLLNIQDGDSLLDLACGQGRHLIELAKRGDYNLYGFDRSRYLLQHAKKNAKLQGVDLNLREGDARKLPYKAETFDFVTILGNSFGYFEASEEDIKILDEVFRVLKPGGKLLMDIADGTFLRDNFTPRSWEWIDKKHFVCRERSLASDNERLISREVVTHADKGVIVDQFYAERLYTKGDLEKLTDKVGFREIQFHGNIKTDSAHTQDPGMMENRFILTAAAVKNWTTEISKNNNRNVVVLMGDPNLADVVKPDGKFDEDDFETVDKLKKALSKLESYNFTYLDNHDTLVADLQRITGKIDLIFNLCDEGFGNNAQKELHVPALLEILDLPYTGSNPQTLAYCYDKSLVRGIATEIGVPLAEASVITAEDNIYELNIPFPVIAKPNFGDSSFGITQNNVAYTIEELIDAILRIKDQFGYRKPILIEEFLTGAEVTVGIIGNLGNYTVLPIIEEDYSELPEGLPKICGYEAKWITDSPYMQKLKSIEANLPVLVEQELVSHSLKLFQRLECKDYCRFDWRLNRLGEPKLLEVNPNPGWCWDSHMAKMSKIGGKDYPTMLKAILNAAEMRYRRMDEKRAT